LGTAGRLPTREDGKRTKQRRMGQRSKKRRARLRIVAASRFKQLGAGFQGETIRTSSHDYETGLQTNKTLLTRSIMLEALGKSVKASIKNLTST